MVPEDAIRVKLLNVAGTRLTGEDAADAQPEFDVKVRLEEIERRTGEAVFDFKMTVNTKPSVVRFDVNGIVNVSGGSEYIEKILQPDPDTKVPSILHRIYQQAFLSFFLLSGILNAPPPPPDLISSSVKSELTQPSEGEENNHKKP